VAREEKFNIRGPERRCDGICDGWRCRRVHRGQALRSQKRATPRRQTPRL
jgi:hypothetical protein